jgi:hypothetical protein
MKPVENDGKVPGLRGPSLIERSLFPLRLVFRAGQKIIPYNCLNPRVVSELLALRRSWTVFTSRHQGVLKDDELKASLNIYGSVWFKEYWISFILAVLGIVAVMGAASLAYGAPGAVLSGLLTYGAYCWWVGSTMNVIRPGELERLLPYLRLDGADRAYLEAVAALSRGDLEHGHKLEILGVLNSLLERDFALQEELGSSPVTAESPMASDVDALRTRVAEMAGTPLGVVYAETLRYAETRSQIHAKAELSVELLIASRRLILEKLLSIRDTLSQLGTTGRSENQSLLALESVDFDSHSLIRALDEIDSLQSL